MPLLCPADFAVLQFALRLLITKLVQSVSTVSVSASFMIIVYDGYATSTTIRPWRTHSILLAPITGMFPLRDELLCRMAKFVLRCISGDNSIVNFVARHGVYFSRMHSLIGLNTQLCCERYSLSLYRFSCINRELIGCSLFRDLNNYRPRSTAGIIYELLLAKSGLGVISSLCVTDIDLILSLIHI